ncbi:MAG: DUF1189 family protein [Tatlockia sp.]|nr:DUF1189 family protein [Tatlockia sp.]
MTKKGKQLSDIDKPIYRYWQALYQSFFNPQVYVDVAKRWRGLGINYLLLVIFIFSIPFAIRFILEFNQFFQDKMVQPISALPTLYIQNGKVSLDKPMPFIIKNKQGQVAAIVDTTGVVKTMDGKYPELAILITQDRLFLRLPTSNFFFSPKETPNTANNIQVYPFSDKANSVFIGKEWVKTSGIQNLKLFFGILIYPTMALVAFGAFLVFILAIALMAQFIARLFFKISITYKQACRLLIVSLTPFMLVFWTLLAFGTISGTYTFFLPLLMFTYFCYAVLALKRESHKLVRS